MKTFTIREAQSRLSKLVKRALAGEKIAITRGGKPVVLLVPIRNLQQPRIPGAMQDTLKVGLEFFEPLSEEELRFWNKEGVS